MTLTRAAIAVHRWLGVALCLPFLLWFLSGIGMMYSEFPSVSEAERFARAAALNPSMVRVPPAEAFAVLASGAPPDAVRLDVLDGRPVYRFAVGAATRLVYADDGAVPAMLSAGAACRVAAAWSRRPAADARVVRLDAVDQWTVEGTYAALRPMWKCAWPGGEEAYVSIATGEVAQYTTRLSRFESYLGPIPHWIYFTPIRRRPLLWRRLVIGLSALAALGAALGLVIGVSRFSPRRRYQTGGLPTSIPYRGWKRRHMALGLLAGLGAVTWAFSGLLSMDPGGTAPAEPPRLLDPPRLAAFAGEPPSEALARLAGLEVTALELATFSGQPVYLAHLAGGGTRVVSADGRVHAEFDRRGLVETLAEKSGGATVSGVRVIDRYDAYYLDRRGQRPLPVLAIALADAGRTRDYVDPNTARVVASYTSRDWVARWLYHGLHSLDFPWLYAHRPAWDLVVIAFMLGGAALSATALLLAWGVVGRTLFTNRPNRVPS